jgi:hypothetical protein
MQKHWGHITPTNLAEMNIQYPPGVPCEFVGKPVTERLGSGAVWTMEWKMVPPQSDGKSGKVRMVGACYGSTEKGKRRRWSAKLGPPADKNHRRTKVIF